MEIKHTDTLGFCNHPDCLYFKPGGFNSWAEYWWDNRYVMITFANKPTEERHTTLKNAFSKPDTYSWMFNDPEIIIEPFQIYTEEVEVPQLGVSMDNEAYDAKMERLHELQKMLEEKWPELAEMHREVEAYVNLEMAILEYQFANHG